LNSASEYGSWSESSGRLWLFSDQVYAERGY
jgi:hypothetical protein